MSKKTESVMTLAAVVASLGTALGVAATDLHAASEATQIKMAPSAVMNKHMLGASQGKNTGDSGAASQGKDPGASQGKNPGVNQGKFQPGANQIKWNDNQPAAADLK